MKVVPGEGPRLRRLATIQHLETRLAAELATPMDPLSLAARLHPTLPWAEARAMRRSR